MSLQLDTRYSGRFTAASTDYPQGSFKNRTTETSQDGSYFEKDWANDELGFRSAILNAVGATANGDVDTAASSQVFDALMQIIRTNAIGVVGQSRNLKMTISTASATGTLTADEIVVETSSGLQYRLKTFSNTINLATTGAGGMDTGTVPATGFVAIYAIYNPTTDVSALLAVNATSVVVPEIYGGANMPSDYTASALLTVLPTASSQFPMLAVQGRSVSTASTSVIAGSAAPGSVTSQVVTAIPLNSVSVDLTSTIGITANDTTGVFSIAPASTLVGARRSTLGASGTGGTISVTSNMSLPILTNSRTFYWQITSATLSYGVTTMGYQI